MKGCNISQCIIESHTRVSNRIETQCGVSEQREMPITKEEWIKFGIVIACRVIMCTWFALVNLYDRIKKLTTTKNQDQPENSDQEPNEEHYEMEELNGRPTVRNMGDSDEDSYSDLTSDVE